MMQSSTNEDIENLVAQFLATALPKEHWTHEAHLVVGVWHVAKYGYEKALTRMRQAIIRYNEVVGTANTDTSGYHETLTVVWLRLIHAIVQDVIAQDVIAQDVIVQANKQQSGTVRQSTVPEHIDIAHLVQNVLEHQFADRSVPLKFYSQERLFSSAARKDFLEPDHRPLP